LLSYFSQKERENIRQRQASYAKPPLSQYCIQSTGRAQCPAGAVFS